jgi:hypothetical protein
VTIFDLLTGWRVVKALQAVGFGGAIEVAHVPTLDNDATAPSSMPSLSATSKAC